MPDSVAILHDRFPQLGGGETFAIEAARALDAPIYTMYVASGVEVPDDVDVIPIRQRKYTGRLTRHFLEWKNRGMNPLETLNVQLDMTDAGGLLSDYDIILESAPLSKAYIPEPHQTIIQYPHSPPRWLFDLYRDRLQAFDYPLVGFAVRAYAAAHRALDRTRNHHVDRFIANSEVIQQRIQRYYGREADVVYPPVTGDWYSNGADDYYVTWSRLEPDKRVDLIVEAFNQVDDRLVVAGTGSQEARLKALADGKGNIEFRGFVDDIEDLVADAQAVVYGPKDEDFGLVGAEALAAGKPLIGVNEGYTKYQAIPGVTGERYDPTVDSLVDVIEAFDPEEFDAEVIQRVADRYSLDTFRSRLQTTVEAVA